jgi:hypothetical protein
MSGDFSMTQLNRLTILLTFLKGLQFSS